MNEFGQIVGFGTHEQDTLRAALWPPVAGPLVNVPHAAVGSEEAR
jgi:hypothetical protein